MLQKIDIDIVETNIVNTSITDANGNLADKININILGKNTLKLDLLPNIIQDKTLFDEYIAYDSAIELNTIETSNNISIQVFAKLPRISINTPIGKYNPDFAYVLQDQGTNKQVFLVIETKGYNELEETSQRELEKISVAEKFFVAVQKRFPNIRIEFRKMINKQNLSEIIDEVLQLERFKDE
jgi:type III restriction enzyme